MRRKRIKNEFENARELLSKVKLALQRNLKKFKNGLKNERNELLLAGFISIGFAIFFVCHARTAIWYEIVGISTYDFTLEQAFLAAIFWSPLTFVVLLTVTKMCRKKHFYGTKGPLLVIITSSTLGLVALVFVSGGINAFNLSYLFALDGLLGIILFLYFNKRETIEFGSGDFTAKLEALRMEHRELLQHVNQTIWAIVVIFTGAVVAGLIPVATNPQTDPAAMEAIGTFLVNNAILIVYFLIGAWFGVITQLYTRLEAIRRNVLILREKGTDAS